MGHCPKCTTYEPPIIQMPPNRISPNMDVRVADIVVTPVVLVLPEFFLISAQRTFEDGRV